jgi:parallel beta-helix repeat protein
MSTNRFAALSLAVALALAGVAVLVGLMGEPAVAQASVGIRYVATTGNDTFNSCTNGNSPCRTVQHAVDVAKPGDAILVSTGVYTDMHVHPVPPGYPDPPDSGTITQVVYISKTVTIAGGYNKQFTYPPNPAKYPTTLSANSKTRGRVVVVVGAISPTLSGLRVTNGDAAGLGGVGGHDAGGGVYVLDAVLTMRDSLVFENSAEDGGGLCLYDSTATLSRNTITSNTASQDGGGLSLYDGGATLSANTVTSNAANTGGGLFLCFSAATLSGNTIRSNTADYGGGLHLRESDAALSGNTIISNTAGNNGGGLYLAGGVPTLIGNAVTSNRAGMAGGGLYLSGSDASLSRNIVTSNTAELGGGLYLVISDPTLTNTVIANNRAGRSGSGLALRGSSPRLLHTTIARNGAGGGGVYVSDWSGEYSSVALTNTVLVSHSVGITVAAGNTATLVGTLWCSNTVDWGGVGAIVTGTHNYWGDPRFEADGYHLMEGSAAIDVGVEAGVPGDVDGERRPRGLAPDLGADEGAGTNIYLPAVLRNSP